MNMNHPLYLIVMLLLLGGHSLSAQSSHQPSPFSSLSKEEYLEDLELFVDTLVGKHPHPYKFTPEAVFRKKVNEKKQLLSDTTTLADFIWHCSELIALLGCSHTSLGWFNQEDAMLPIELRFPLDAILMEDRLYVSNPLRNGTKVQAGAEIFSINGYAISEITALAFQHISSQAHIQTYKRLLFSAYMTAYIPFALGFPEKYEIVIKGSTSPILLDPLTHYKPRPRYQRIVSNDPCSQDLCFRLHDTSTAILAIKSFAYYGERFATFQSFIDERFKELRTRGIKNLILDLRFNGGGASLAANHLLKYLAKGSYTYFRHNEFNHLKEKQEPFDHTFDGSLYILIDGDGQSTTGHFLSLIHELKLGTIIGEELASNGFCTANQKKYSLPHSGISFSVARNTFITSARAAPDTHGILPDHFIKQSIEDHLNNIDTVLQYALELIENERFR